MMSYVPLHNATKEYVVIPEGRFMFAPELTVKEYGPVPPEINRSSSAMQSPVQRLLETTDVDAVSWGGCVKISGPNSS